MVLFINYYKIRGRNEFNEPCKDSDEEVEEIDDSMARKTASLVVHGGINFADLSGDNFKLR